MTGTIFERDAEPDPYAVEITPTALDAQGRDRLDREFADLLRDIDAFFKRKPRACKIDLTASGLEPELMLAIDAAVCSAIMEKIHTRDSRDNDRSRLARLLPDSGKISDAQFKALEQLDETLAGLGKGRPGINLLTALRLQTAEKLATRASPAARFFKEIGDWLRDDKAFLRGHGVIAAAGVIGTGVGFALGTPPLSASLVAFTVSFAAVLGLEVAADVADAIIRQRARKSDQVLQGLKKPGARLARAIARLQAEEGDDSYWQAVRDSEATAQRIAEARTTLGPYLQPYLRCREQIIQDRDAQLAALDGQPAHLHKGQARWIAGTAEQQIASASAKPAFRPA